MKYTIELSENNVNYTTNSYALILLTNKDKGANIFVNYETDFLESRVEFIKDIEINYLNNVNWVDIMHFVTSDDALNKIKELINNDLNR